MTHHFRTLALAGLALLAACGPKEQAAPATPPLAPAATETPGGAPALWRVGDADTTLYLFGTVHVLPPGLQWRTPALDKALADSKAVYFETDVEPDPRELQTLVTSLGMYAPPEKLSDHLTPEAHAAIAAAAGKLQLPMTAIDMMKPWLAAQALSQQLIVNAGYNPESGAERTLYPDAVAAKKDIRKFETVAEQLGFLAGLPETTQIDFLVDGVDKLDEASALLGDLVAAWARGDVDSIERLMIEGDLADTPEVYEALLVARNRNWAATAETLIKTEPGVFLAAVGAGHLAGDKSLQVMLTQKGYTVERVE